MELLSDKMYLMSKLSVEFVSFCKVVMKLGAAYVTQISATKPSTVISKSNHTVKCILEDTFFILITHETAVTANETCMREYCTLSRSPGGYTKICINTSIETKLSSKKFAFETIDEQEIYICNQNWCNIDVETAPKG